MMRNIELENVINQELNVGDFQDYAPNGLQVEGRAHIQRIVTGVTACQALLDEAVRLQADAVIVHHGYFWKNEPAVIRGMKRNRLKTLLCNDINLYGYHLPLDAHPSLGNNVQLARLINAKVVGLIEPFVPHGEFEQPITPVELAARIEQALGRKALYVGDNAPAEIRKLAWCTGGGQGFIQQAAEFGVDAFITGEVSEQTVHIAREMGLHFYAAGHHATERYGVKALGEWLAGNYGLDVTFIDIPNPV
ncbi:Nif3-like dinuclear metal center protein [Photorhabdus luminescens]|uniref:GTP cyclohydrolase 1 type 2 homolog n=2 Tax=Photorhabdus TaxID=29487 RepID=A0A329VAZ7_9GAMM|nr:Nif3-like dinuclear metal center protein [Photorhabdus luminescens]RAW84250.1 Nif3-like dinuclear metal center protein [Photorhabdus laumondii subsp. clarkei]